MTGNLEIIIFYCLKYNFHTLPALNKTKLWQYEICVTGIPDEEQICIMNHEES